ncbi:chaperone protein dnaJ 11, chloroplastic-like [Impatiens glandulifera]|uniref:chaperone protein dnaJ 11, chloroplastic-like n=1 Tax=Impatiens glandulifera TaxID=253017 RepID=UPI001FB0C611|nr:chaperone protein dnaJ 11, chloroplastic-like [Impatiens glandulifera]
MVSTSSSSFLGSSSSSSTAHLRISVKKLSPPPRPSSVRFRSSSYESTCLSHPKLASNRTSFYEVLRIPVGATGTEIKAAYRKLARIFHPDVVSDVDRRDSCANEFIKIHNAYSILSDPDKRADYDNRNIHVFPNSNIINPSIIRSYNSPPPPVRSSYSGYNPRRNWDKDQCW